MQRPIIPIQPALYYKFRLIESLLPLPNQAEDTGKTHCSQTCNLARDPANPTLVQVTMNTAAGADDLFRILMGEKVEPRREYIEKHALDVQNLDV